MAKSNGIKDLKQAAKLLNKHAPKGESLAYINPGEARLLKAHGGSGIETLSGVPSYNWFTETVLPWIVDKGSDVVDWLGYSQDGVGGKELIKDVGKLGLSTLAFFEAKKDREGLTAHEQKIYNDLKAQGAAADLQFALNVGEGPKVENVPTTIEDVASFTDVTLPTMKTTAVAEGGRIGYNLGGIGAMDPRIGYAEGLGPMGRQMGPGVSETENFTWGGPDVVETANMREEALFNKPLWNRDIQALEKEQIEKFEDLVAQEKSNQRKRMHMALKEYQDMAQSNNLYDALEIARRMGDTEFVNFWSEYTPSGDRSVEDPGFSTASGALGAAYGGRIGAQEGGIMPLLNLGGMEKDYRQDGGFVPIGRREKADDVPARLSKNEFVFTADAVRNAGGGNIDKGAQRMYNVMKNLEAGGEISEQSQGQV